jgi:hypothetical protein
VAISSIPYIHYATPYIEILANKESWIEKQESLQGYHILSCLKKVVTKELVSHHNVVAEIILIDND